MVCCSFCMNLHWEVYITTECFLRKTIDPDIKMSEAGNLSASSSDSSLSSACSSGGGAFRTSSRHHKKDLHSMAATVPELIKILGGNRVIEKVRVLMIFKNSFYCIYVCRFRFHIMFLKNYSSTYGASRVYVFCCDLSAECVHFLSRTKFPF